MILAIAGLGVSWSIHASCDRLSCIRITGSQTWKESAVYEHTNTSYRALLNGDHLTIRVEKYSPLSAYDAALLTKVDGMKILGLFDDARSPYPGDISDRITCDKSLKPTIAHLQANGADITYYAGWLNNRLQYGTCTDTDLPYIAYNAYFYCPEERADYHLEFITARENKNDGSYLSLIRSIRCLPSFLGHAAGR